MNLLHAPWMPVRNAQGRWMVLLPLALTPEGWVGEALAAPRRGQPARRLQWIYDTRTGLRLLESGQADNAASTDSSPGTTTTATTLTAADTTEDAAP